MSPQFQELISFCEVVLNQPHVSNASPPKAQVCQNPLKHEARLLLLQLKGFCSFKIVACAVFLCKHKCIGYSNTRVSEAIRKRNINKKHKLQVKSLALGLEWNSDKETSRKALG